MREWQEGMGEISGFGGNYEAGCRAMVLAGIAWIDEHPNAVLEAHSFKNVFGVLIPHSKDAKALEQAMLDAEVQMDDGETVKVRDECTGAMHHAAFNHVFAYRRLGWTEYVRQLTEREDDE